jgi:hypothetical protein
MGLLGKHPINSITLKPTSTSFPRKKNEKGKEKKNQKGKEEPMLVRV